MPNNYKIYGDTNQGYITLISQSASEAKAYYEKFYPEGGDRLRVEIDGGLISDIRELDPYIASEES